MTDAFTKGMLGTAVGIGAAGLALHSLKLLPKVKPGKKKGTFKVKPVSNKKLLKAGVTTIVGIGLLGATAGMVNKL